MKYLVLFLGFVLFSTVASAEKTAPVLIKSVSCAGVGADGLPTKFEVVTEATTDGGGEEIPSYTLKPFTYNIGKTYCPFLQLAKENKVPVIFDLYSEETPISGNTNDSTRLIQTITIFALP